LTAVSAGNAVLLQEEIAKRVIEKDAFQKQIEYACGIDVSYRNKFAYCSAVVIRKSSFEVEELINTKSVIQHEYIPGLFMLREADPILNSLKLLKTAFELLLIDGHGRLHPRKCGLASYIGVITNKPTIGVAKHLLCGSVREDGFVEFDNIALGFRIKLQDKRPVYVSIGNKISLESAIYIVKQFTKNGEVIPEPLRIADANSKNCLNFL
jgi:deoxyribonuclease V